MKTVGIIAEYNPFHNGHLYQINQIKKLMNADYVVVVMSGNYVQRGTPAIIDKYTRTKMALMNHVDAVFELPVCYATASAEYFAYGAVSLLHQLGVVDYLCFGSECGDLSLMKTITDYLINEPANYRDVLLQYQKKGETYPKARAFALSETIQNAAYTKDELFKALSSPNNILGIEYLKALNRLDSPIEPVTIKREGAGYHSNDLNQVNPSATAIRKHLLEKASTNELQDLPEPCIHLLKESLGHTYPVTSDDFSSLLYYQLTMQFDQLTSFFDVSSDLANRIQNLMSPHLIFSSFAETLKSKQLTSTRVYRSLLHVLLDIKQDEFLRIHSGNTMYARLLGFQRTSSTLLKEVQRNSICPVITKVADAKTHLDNCQYSMFLKDISAAHLYDQVVYSKFHQKLKDEYTVGPVIL